MNILRLALAGLLMTAPALPADPVAATAPSLLPADSLAEALPILKAKYADFAALHYNKEDGDRLSDLIARSGGGISLLTPVVSSAPLPILTASLPGGITYWRLASFAPKTNWADLESELRDASAHGDGGAILDLRGNSGLGDLAGAAQILHDFAPGDETLASFYAENSTPNLSGTKALSTQPFRGPVVVLINNQTAGAAEVLAARLKADGALVIGRPTPGHAAVLEEKKLSSGQVLRYVAAHVRLADGADAWGRPVTPDIAPTVDDRSEKGALVLIGDSHILDVIQEAAERHRMSEASLVQGDDPEWDDYLASLEKKPTHFLLSLPPLHDVVLIRALDSLKAIRLSQLPAPTPAAAGDSVSVQ